MSTKIQAYLPDDLYLEAKLAAQSRNQNFSNLLREAVQEYLVKIQPRKPKRKLKTVTLKGVGTTDAALTHNDIYDLKPAKKK